MSTSGCVATADQARRSRAAIARRPPGRRAAVEPPAAAGGRHRRRRAAGTRATCSANSAAFSPAASATDLQPVGVRRRRRRARCWPIEPVEPRMAMRFTASSQAGPEKHVEDRRREQQRVDAIEHAAVAGDQRWSCPSRRRCASAATRTGRRRCRAPRRATPSSRRSQTGHAPAATSARRRAAAAAPTTKPADRALDRLLRADGAARAACGPNSAAGVELRRVADDHGRHQQQHAPRARRSRGCATSAPSGRPR